MASLSISGNNASYTVTLSEMDTSTRYHVFIEDLSSTGKTQGYYCRRSSLGASSSWSYSGTSSSPYSTYPRAVRVYISSKAITEFGVGTRYSLDYITTIKDKYDATLFEIKSIPAASSVSYTLTISDFSDMVKAVYLSGTRLTPDDNSCDFAKDKEFGLISLTDAASSWIGTIYWGTYSGSTQYPIANVNNGVLDYYSNIEKVTYTGSNRKIYLTAIGKTTYKYRVHLLTTLSGSYFSGTKTEYYYPSSSTWYTSTSSSIELTLTDYPKAYCDGYTFVGWSISNYPLSANYYTDTYSFTATSSGKVVTLYARFTKDTYNLSFTADKGVSSFTVTYQDRGGVEQLGHISSSVGTKTYKVKAGTTAVIKDVVYETGYKESYTLWELDENGNYKGTSPSVTATSDRYFKIFSEALIQYTVTFKGNGGTWESDESGISTRTLQYYENEKIDLSVLSNDLTYDRHTLINWKCSDGNWYGTEVEVVPNSNRTTFTAQWEQNSYNFTFKMAETNKGLPSYSVWLDGNESNAVVVKAGQPQTLSVKDSQTVYIGKMVINPIMDNGKTINRNGYNTPLITAYADSGSGMSDQSDYIAVINQGSASTSPTFGTYTFTGGHRPYHHTFVVGSQTKFYTYKLYANNGYWTDGATNPKSGGVYATSPVSFSNYSSLVDRIRYSLAGWGLSASGGKVTTPSGTYWITENTDFYAVWTRAMALFYWSGENDTKDASLIAKGLPTANLTATMWNNFKQKIVDLGTELTNLPAMNLINNTGKVGSGGQITATEFNNVRKVLSQLDGCGALPDARNSGNKVLASYFNGSGSLKTALNAAITYWNNNN